MKDTGGWIISGLSLGAAAVAGSVEHVELSDQAQALLEQLDVMFAESEPESLDWKMILALGGTFNGILWNPLVKRGGHMLLDLLQHNTDRRREREAGTSQADDPPRPPRQPGPEDER